MNIRQILVLIVGLLLCGLWVDVITARFHTDGHDKLVIDPKTVVAWIIGWVSIMGLTFLVMKISKKKW